METLVAEIAPDVYRFSTYVQAADLTFLPVEADFEVNRGRVKVDPATYATNVRGVFACGDFVTGPTTLIEAAGHGKKAAYAIDRYLAGRTDVTVAANVAVQMKEIAQLMGKPVGATDVEPSTWALAATTCCCAAREASRARADRMILPTIASAIERLWLSQCSRAGRTAASMADAISGLFRRSFVWP